MSGAALVLHQFRFDQKTFWRNPASVFFTVLLPVIFLLIFATIFGNDTIEELGGIKTTTYYVPAIITLAVVSATMQSLAISLTVDRENGLLKRIRGTPLPTWVFVAGRVGNAVVVSVLSLIVVATIGRIVYGVEIPWDRLPAVLAALVVGAASLLLPRLRADRGDPQRGRRAADHQRRAAAALLPLRRLHPRDRDPGGRPRLRRPVPDPPLLRGVLHRLDPTTTGAGFEWGQPRDRRRLGRRRPADRAAVLPLGAAQT